MNQGNKPNYGAEEIRKYHSGELTAAQRHALESAALEDPFLADALEGYAYTNTPEADLESIRKRIAPPARRKVLPFLLRAAVLIAAVSGMLFLILREDKGTEISTLPESLPRTVPQTVPQTVPDNKVEQLETETETETEREREREGAREERTVQKTTNSTAGNRVKKPEAAPQVLKEEADLAIQQAPAPQVAMDSNRNARNFNARVAETSGSVAKISDRSVRQDTIKNLDVVLPENKAALSEVVVTNLGGKPRAYAPPDPKFETLEPTQGWQIYNDYIANNLKDSDANSRKKKIASTGEVELQFDTNTLGEPENIKITESHCKTCEKEAIRLLREGPKWQAGMKEQKIRIRF